MHEAQPHGAQTGAQKLHEARAHGAQTGAQKVHEAQPHGAQTGARKLHEASAHKARSLVKICPGKNEINEAFLGALFVLNLVLLPEGFPL